MFDNDRFQGFFRTKLLKYFLSMMRPPMHTLNSKKEIVGESNMKFKAKRSTSFIVNFNIALLMGFRWEKLNVISYYLSKIVNYRFEGTISYDNTDITDIQNREM